VLEIDAGISAKKYKPSRVQVSLATATNLIFLKKLGIKNKTKNKYKIIKTKKTQVMLVKKIRVSLCAIQKPKTKYLN
jgi:hypothetical protein